MHRNKAKVSFFLISLLSAFIGLASLSSSVSANDWAGGEKTGFCDIPTPDTPFDCSFGPYTLSAQNRSDGFRYIGGFYVNPRHALGGGTLPMEYSINGGPWISRNLVYGSGSANYINLGNGVSSLSFRFTQQPSNFRMGSFTRTSFTFNYDMDR